MAKQTAFDQPQPEQPTKWFLLDRRETEHGLVVTEAMTLGAISHGVKRNIVLLQIRTPHGVTSQVLRNAVLVPGEYEGDIAETHHLVSGQKAYAGVARLGCVSEDV